MKPATVNRRAKELIDNSKIAARLTELQSEAAEKSKLTLESHLEKLRELRDAAADFGQFSAAIRAEIARGKAAGLYREQIDLNNTAFTQQSDVIILELPDNGRDKI